MGFFKRELSPVERFESALRDKQAARQKLADLFLDTLPVNAHTTASDALWAGLPVLTCAGQTFAGRVAGSLLKAAGLPELVTYSLEEYEALALRLAQNPAQLADMLDLSTFTAAIKAVANASGLRPAKPGE